MSVVLTISDNQAKALEWLLGSVTSGVNEDLGLNPIYDRLHEVFGYVEVTGVVRSEWGCWSRSHGKHAALVGNPEGHTYIDVT